MIARARNAQSLLCSRRELLKAGAAIGVGAIADLFSPSAIRALTAPSTPGSLIDIEHVVFVMQENRSFDHYFGTYPAVRGFGDKNAISGVFEQSFSKNTSLAPVGKIFPYHLDTTKPGYECTPDPGHSWGTQHDCWNGGAMDQWGTTHSGDVDWSFMGFYTRADLPYYYAVADAFTICDAYHCSVMGSTTSNRLYALTGMLDPNGKYGGPVLSTITWSQTSRGVLDAGWVTYPEVLLDAGVSWKYYSTPDADTQEQPLVNFKQYYPGYSSDPALNARAAKLFDGIFGQTYENFLTDAAAGNLPQVSWVNTHVTQQEHPSAAPQDGEVALQAIVDAVTANPLTWSRTVVFYTYDENGGFFDHVPPPTAPLGTAGEFVKNSNGTYDTLPIGLGFRVPMLIISPFSRGGFVARHVFDHTSQLRFVERWLTAKGFSNVTVPNLSAWRRSIVGDLTSALNFAAPNNSIPTLPLQEPTNLTDHPECATEEVSMAASPTPTSQSLPAQEAGKRPSPSGLRTHQ